jgi:hypothetical protein
MPTFYQNDFDIEVDDFLNNCDNEEINEIISYLRENDYLTNGLNSYIDDSELNLLEHEWNKLISFISDSRLSISNEDEDIIRTIAKKYGYYQ